MKVKFSVIPFIPAAIIMLFLRVMSVIGVDESGVFLGMDRMALSYTVIGIALAHHIIHELAALVVGVKAAEAPLCLQVSV